MGEVVFRRNAAEVTGALPGVEYEDVIPEEGRLNKNVSLKEVTKKGLEFLEGDVLFGKLRPYLKNWLLLSLTVSRLEIGGCCTVIR